MVLCKIKNHITIYVEFAQQKKVICNGFNLQWCYTYVYMNYTWLLHVCSAYTVLSMNNNGSSCQC